MDEFDDDFDCDEDDETETMVCQNCRADVYEDAEQCPYCGEYITRWTSVFSDRPWWWIALGLAGIVAVIFALSVAGAWG